MAYPYTAAFIGFTRGVPVEDLAAEFKIPISALREKIAILAILVSPKQVFRHELVEQKRVGLFRFRDYF